jgi:hypothetical protein
MVKLYLRDNSIWCGVGIHEMVLNQIWRVAEMELIGICLVSVGFVLLRFFFTCPKNIWSHLNPTSRNLFFYSQNIFYWSVLIAGLGLCFLSAIKIGLLTLGCFLVLYYKSIDYLFSEKAIPRAPSVMYRKAGVLPASQ